MILELNVGMGGIIVWIFRESADKSRNFAIFAASFQNV